MDEKTIKELKRRINRLEKAVFGDGKKPRKKVERKAFTGAKGGIQLLISKGFFKKKRTAPDVKKELENNDYFYKIQVVQTTLNRLSGRKGPLAAFKEKGKKVYINRK